jgi:hypothetical protein
MVTSKDILIRFSTAWAPVYYFSSKLVDEVVEGLSSKMRLIEYYNNPYRCTYDHVFEVDGDFPAYDKDMPINWLNKKNRLSNT